MVLKVILVFLSQLDFSLLYRRSQKIFSYSFYVSEVQDKRTKQKVRF